MEKEAKKHKIIQVEEGSIAEELGIEPGDVLLSINDKEIEDVFDFDFLCMEEYIEVLIRKADGEEWLLEVDKEPDEDMGLVEDLILPEVDMSLPEYYYFGY